MECASPSTPTFALVDGLTRWRRAVGGTATIKALAGPRPAVQFNPTGGVSETNLKEYLALPNVVAAGGCWLAPAAEVAAGHWDGEGGT
jgi:2-keto-3-deoxy-6-phosphogluconate aldolase